MESIHELLANDLVNASVPICWETHITAFNSSGGTDISGGVAGDMCSGEQKIRGNTYLRYTGFWLLFKKTRGSALAALMVRCICSTLPPVSVS